MICLPSRLNHGIVSMYSRSLAASHWTKVPIHQGTCRGPDMSWRLGSAGSPWPAAVLASLVHASAPRTRYIFEREVRVPPVSRLPPVSRPPWLAKQSCTQKPARCTTVPGCMAHPPPPMPSVRRDSSNLRHKTSDFGNVAEQLWKTTTPGERAERGGGGECRARTAKPAPPRVAEIALREATTTRCGNSSLTSHHERQRCTKAFRALPVNNACAVSAKRSWRRAGANSLGDAMCSRCRPGPAC